MRLLFSLLLIILVGCNSEVIKEEVIVEEVMQKPIIKEEINPWFKTYADNYALNNDYLGNICFDSGLFDLPVLKSDSYDEYLRVDWKTLEYAEGGSIFIDPYANLDSQNICFYGHNYEDGVSMFSPLHLLRDEENYADNRFISLKLANEIRKYEVAHVFFVEIKSNDGYSYIDDLFYMQSTYNEDELDAYLLAIDAVEFYDTKIDIDHNDRFITLQTCVLGHDELRLIVVAKEIENIQLR